MRLPIGVSVQGTRIGVTYDIIPPLMLFFVGSSSKDLFIGPNPVRVYELLNAFCDHLDCGMVGNTLFAEI